MSKQNMCFTIIHQIIFNFSISNADREINFSAIFALLCDVSDMIVDS